MPHCHQLPTRSLQACTAIVAAVGRDGQPQEMEAVLRSLARMAQVLQALDTCLGSFNMAAMYEDTVWSAGVLPLVDTLLYSDRCVPHSCWSCMRQPMAGLPIEALVYDPCLSASLLLTMAAPPCG